MAYCTTKDGEDLLRDRARDNPSCSANWNGQKFF
jgi:hypothetical protein